MPSATSPPLVGVSASRGNESGRPSHRCAEKYLQAVVDPGGCAPVVLPALPDPRIRETWLDALDGLLLTGGAANVEPHHYRGEPSVEGTLHDPRRDATMLPVIRACVERGIPVLGICLGIQEMNVAFGGSLHQRLHESDGLFDHRMRRDEDDQTRRYRPSHSVDLAPDGVLREITGVDRMLVNSLHAQGLDRLGTGIRMEAVSPDGVIEAISLVSAPGFALGVQWHPEWPRPIDEHNQRIFEAFGAAARAHAEARRTQPERGRTPVLAGAAS